MVGKAKRPFDPKVFLSKVNGGKAISDYRKGQIVYTQGAVSYTHLDVYKRQAYNFRSVAFGLETVCRRCGARAAR